jgi:hypothetical protein
VLSVPVCQKLAYFSSFNCSGLPEACLFFVVCSGLREACLVFQCYLFRFSKRVAYWNGVMTNRKAKTGRGQLEKILSLANIVSTSSKNL